MCLQTGLQCVHNAGQWIRAACLHMYMDLHTFTFENVKSQLKTIHINKKKDTELFELVWRMLKAFLGRSHCSSALKWKVAPRATSVYSLLYPVYSAVNGLQTFHKERSQRSAGAISVQFFEMNLWFGNLCESLHFACHSRKRRLLTVQSYLLM